MIKRKRKLNKQRTINHSRRFTIVGNGDYVGTDEGDYSNILHYFPIGLDVYLIKDFGTYKDVGSSEYPYDQCVASQHLK